MKRLRLLIFSDVVAKRSGADENWAPEDTTRNSTRFGFQRPRTQKMITHTQCLLFTPLNRECSLLPAFNPPFQNCCVCLPVENLESKTHMPKGYSNSTAHLKKLRQSNSQTFLKSCQLATEIQILAVKGKICNYFLKHKQQGKESDKIPWGCLLVSFKEWWSRTHNVFYLLHWIENVHYLLHLIPPFKTAASVCLWRT